MFSLLNIENDLRLYLFILLAIIGSGLILTLLLFILVIWRIRRINIPPDAGFFEALRATPFLVVLLLDLLDFTFDIFSAPFAWMLLNYLGLKPLRGVTVIESLIPGTQLIPTMSIAWLLARIGGMERFQPYLNGLDKFPD